ncbi:MAG: cytochrome P450, partial [Solirubrobacteraceae bacterium]
RPLQRRQRAAGQMLCAELLRRWANPGDREDVLSLLIEETDEGVKLSDDAIRDQVMTLLFAGHDTTTATVSFLFHELARNPRDADPERLPELIDETLRLYPPAWVGPRRVARDVEVCGHLVPAGVHINYCSYASHRLPDVWPDPEAFLPERFAPDAKAALPKSAYVPFGGGSRTCIGMRFGLLEIRAIATLILARFRPRLASGYQLEVRQMPTIGPRRGMPLLLEAR